MCSILEKGNKTYLLHGWGRGLYIGGGQDQGLSLVDYGDYLYYGYIMTAFDRSCGYS